MALVGPAYGRFPRLPGPGRDILDRLPWRLWVIAYNHSQVTGNPTVRQLMMSGLFLRDSRLVESTSMISTRVYGLSALVQQPMENGRGLTSSQNVGVTRDAWSG